MKNFLPIGILVALVFVLYLATTPSQAPTPETPTPEEFLTTDPDTSMLQAGGSSYFDPKGVYGFLYPNDYTLDTQNDGLYTRIFKRGATQQGQTEIYDGVLVVFEAVELQTQSLEELVDSRIEEATAGGTAEILQPKKAVILNGYSGFTYQTSGFGAATYLVLQKGPQSDYAVSISFSINDPENVGYTDEVESVLATLNLLK